MLPSSKITKAAESVSEMVSYPSNVLVKHLNSNWTQQVQNGFPW
jgi:hypothetical protein